MKSPVMLLRVNDRVRQLFDMPDRPRFGEGVQGDRVIVQVGLLRFRVAPDKAGFLFDKRR